MKRLCLSFCFLLMINFCISQKAVTPMSINSGDYVKETVKLFDTTNKLVGIRVPSYSCMLFYRYRGNNWLMDNRDSLEKIENIVQNLLNSSPLFKNMRLICVAYNKDNFLNTYNKPVFKNYKDYTPEYYYSNDKSPTRLTNSNKLVLIDKRGRVLTVSAHISDFNYVYKPESTILKAKLLTESNGVKTPVVNAIVYLSSELKEDTLSKAKTNNYGDFELLVPDNAVNHALKANSSDPSVQDIILASQEGVEITRIRKSPFGFEYKLIPQEIYRLSDMYVEDDLSTVFGDFLSKKEKELIRIEDINYNSGSYSIKDDSKKILDKVAGILTDNRNIKLEVISHTDAQGDDHSNMELSEKRSLAVVTYLILIGVDKDRLKYTGKGETEIRNRCANGVDCSDIEHRYNRRTEFRFIKE
jgi:outer membrane protein OmpA-like peptidoglycan-associated protein